MEERTARKIKLKKFTRSFSQIPTAKKVLQREDVNAGSHRWSKSPSKVCQTCDRGEDGTAEHVVLECERSDSDNGNVTCNSA